MVARITAEHGWALEHGFGQVLLNQGVPSLLNAKLRARRESDPTIFARHPPKEASPIAFAAPGALGVLIALKRLDLAPVVPANQAPPIP
jgi:hypothetical protein